MAKVNDKVVELYNEIARLKRGDFTPEEFQNLCHNLDVTQPGISRECFSAGCVAYIEKLFGPVPPSGGATGVAEAGIHFLQQGPPIVEVAGVVTREAQLSQLATPNDHYLYKQVIAERDRLVRENAELRQKNAWLGSELNVIQRKD